MPELAIAPVAELAPEIAPVAVEPELVQVETDLELVRAAAVPGLGQAAAPGRVQVAAQRALDLAVAGRRLVLVAARIALATKISGAVHAAAETRSAAGVVVVAGDTPLAPVATGAAIA